MTDTWEHTRSSIRRLKTALRDADEDARYKFSFWVTGLAMMGGAIVVQFGWVGVVFCAGLVVHRAAGHQ